MRRRIALALALLVAVACNSRNDGDETITVLAASSLTEVFEEIAADFEEANPEASVELGFGASSDLATQVQEGAPADVFASADEANMDKVVESGDAGDPEIFARNQLAIAVEPGNPLGIESIADLAEPNVVVVLCASEVPCGRFADEALANAGVELTPASRAENVKAALSLVELGEADAAIVYVTDVASSDEVEGVEIPDAENVIATYPIAVLEESGNREAADAFVAYVRSSDGQAALERFGFLPP